MGFLKAVRRKVRDEVAVAATLIRSLGLILVSVSWSVPIEAQLSETFTFSQFNQNSDASALAIPDGNAAGVSDSRMVSSGISGITSVQVSLDIASDFGQDSGGAFNGDLYIYLRHDNGLAILLNRPGLSSGNIEGYADVGLFITLSDTAANGDVHLYRGTEAPAKGAPLTGLWQPDGRNLDPGSSPAVFDSTSRSATLSSFNGMDPNGLWVLYAADLQSGGASKIEGWGLQFTGVPEPASFSLLTAIALLCLSASRLKVIGRRR
jgi:subtilisin-like proprotein convertase family protein